MTHVFFFLVAFIIIIIIVAVNQSCRHLMGEKREEEVGADSLL